MKSKRCFGKGIVKEVVEVRFAHSFPSARVYLARFPCPVLSLSLLPLCCKPSAPSVCRPLP